MVVPSYVGRKLQNELATLTQDYLSCKNEMEKANKETQDMRVQMHDYIAKVRTAEETLHQKVCLMDFAFQISFRLK